jgi:hypothetical protein
VCYWYRDDYGAVQCGAEQCSQCPVVVVVVRDEESCWGRLGRVLRDDLVAKGETSHGHDHDHDHDHDQGTPSQSSIRQRIMMTKASMRGGGEGERKKGKGQRTNDKGTKRTKMASGCYDSLSLSL